MIETEIDLEAELYDERSLAAYLMVSCAVLRYWRARAEGPSFTRVGGRLIRYRRADVEAWLDANAVCP